jgi:hypothetical protein
MPGYRYDGAQFVEMDGRSGNGSYRRRWNGYEWVRMGGWRYDGVDWVELWPQPGSVSGITLVPLWLNLDESPILSQPFTFNLTKDQQF